MNALRYGHGRGRVRPKPSRELSRRDALIRAGIRPPAAGFRWRDQDGNFWRPEDMATRHLFFTLRMIWNHTMPEAAQIHPYRAYTFRPFYTRQYMAEAVMAVGWELLGRDDLCPKWRSDLDWMVRWLATRQLEDRRDNP